MRTLRLNRYYEQLKQSIVENGNYAEALLQTANAVYTVDLTNDRLESVYYNTSAKEFDNDVQTPCSYSDYCSGRSRYVTEDTLENYRIVDSSFKILKRFATGSRQITVEYCETGKNGHPIWLQKTVLMSRDTVYDAKTDKESKVVHGIILFKNTSDFHEKEQQEKERLQIAFEEADAENKAVLAVRGRGVLFHPGGAAVQSHHLKTGHGARTGRDRCAVEHRTGQRGQRRRADADAHAQRPHWPPRHRPWAVCGFACAVGGVLGGAGLVGGGVLRRAHLLLLGAGCGAARPFHRPVRPAPRGGELRLSGAGAERGQPCVPFCSQPAGAEERAAPACYGRCGGGFCGHLGAASGAERPALKRAKRKGRKKVCRCLRQN